MDFFQGLLRRIDRSRGRIVTVAGIIPRAYGENGPAIAAQLDPDMWQAAINSNGRLVFGGGPRLRRLEGDGTLKTRDCRGRRWRRRTSPPRVQRIATGTFSSPTGKWGKCPPTASIRR